MNEIKHGVTEFIAHEPKFLVRTNCEYSIEVYAPTEEVAKDIAEQTPLSHWSQAWAPYEAEPQS